MLDGMLQAMREAPRTPTVDAPCIRNCCLDLDEVCLGCHRSLQEILSWSRATTAERERVLAEAAGRAARRAERLRAAWGPQDR